MIQSRAIINLIAWIFSLWATGAVVATAKEIPLPDAHAYVNRGIDYYEKGDPGRAIADLSRAIQLDPKEASAYVYVYRGLSYAEMGDNDRAIADFTRAIELDPTMPVYPNRGLAYHKKGEFDRTIGDYNHAIELNPNDAWLYFARGAAYYDKGDTGRAIADFTRAIQLDPKEVRFYRNRGVAYYNKRDTGRAIADFTRAIQLDPKYARENDVDRLLATLQEPQPHPRLRRLRNRCSDNPCGSRPFRHSQRRWSMKPISSRPRTGSSRPRTGRGTMRISGRMRKIPLVRLGVRQQRSRSSKVSSESVYLSQIKERGRKHSVPEFHALVGKPFSGRCQGGADNTGGCNWHSIESIKRVGKSARGELFELAMKYWEMDLEETPRASPVREGDGRGDGTAQSYTEFVFCSKTFPAMIIETGNNEWTVQELFPDEAHPGVLENVYAKYWAACHGNENRTAHNYNNVKWPKDGVELTLQHPTDALKW